MCRTHTRRWTHLPERKETRLPLIRTEGITRIFIRRGPYQSIVLRHVLVALHQRNPCSSLVSIDTLEKTGIHVHAFHASVLITSRCFITLDLSKFTVHYPHDNQDRMRGKNKRYKTCCIQYSLRSCHLSSFTTFVPVLLPSSLLHPHSFFLLYSDQESDYKKRRGKEIADISQVL